MDVIQMWGHYSLKITTGIVVGFEENDFVTDKATYGYGML